jgi:dynein heavy chain
LIKKEVESFKVKISEEYETYKSKGPGTGGISLDEGVELLNQSKEKVKGFNKTREENVLAEKLFNLPISKFPELIKMEEENKVYTIIYDVFKEFRGQMKEFSVMSWSKLDVNQLITAAEKYDK